MSYRREAQEACSAAGTVKSLKMAVQDSINHFDPFGRNDWQEFARLAFQSGNNEVFEYILESVSDPLAMLESLQQLYEGETQAQLSQWIEKITSKQSEKIRKIAIEVDRYDAWASKHIRDLLYSKPQFQMFAALKAMELCNASMLNDILNIIGNHKNLNIEEHHTLYNRLVATLNGLKRCGVEKNISCIEAVLNDKFRIPDRTRPPTPTHTTSKPKIVSKSSGKSLKRLQ